MNDSKIFSSAGIEMYNGLPNHLFYRAARHEQNPLHVTLWNIIANLDPEPIMLMGNMMASGTVLMKMAHSGTAQLPSVKKPKYVYIFTLPSP